MYKGYFKKLLALSFLSLLFFPFDTVAQMEVSDITTKFEDYHEQLAPEKVYLHTNRELFTLGDTLHFGAYVLNGKDHSPTYVSRVLYAELLAPTDSIVGSLKLKIDSLGRSSGSFTLSDNLFAGQYTLRAYTQYQMNFDLDYFFTKSIKLLPRLETQDIIEDSPDKVPQVMLKFFPEGGELIAGTINTIAFKATDQYGNPLDIKGDIFDETGTKITSISCEHDGMGVLQLFLEEGKQYTCNYQYAGRFFSQPLPNALSSGYLLNVRKTSGRWHTEVKPIDTSIENAFIILQCRGEILYVIGPQSGAESIKFSLSETELPHGVIHMTFFDPQHRAVAERLIYNDNREYLGTLDITTDKNTYAKRSKVNVDFGLKMNQEEVLKLATISTTVIPQKLRKLPEHSITSFLFITSDLKGYIHQPTYYVNPKNPDRLRHLDLLMMTHGWRRFEWDKLTNGELPEINYLFEQGIRIEGTVSGYVDRNKPSISDVQLNFMENPAFQMETTSLENGLFWFDRLKFTDTLTAHLLTLPESTRRAKKKNSTFIQIHDRVIPPIQENYRLPYVINAKDELLIARGKQLYNIYTANDGKTVNLEGLKPTSVEKTEKDPFRNRQGMIYSNPDYRIFLDSIPQYYRDIFQYLYGAPGVVVTGFAPNARAKIRGAQSFNSPTDPLYLLDGIERDETFVNNLNPLNILFIDVLKGTNATVYGSRGSTGAIALYSREAGDFREVEDQELAGETMYRLAGYTPPREFYMPDYSNPPESEQMTPDFRSTIYWNPILTLESGKSVDQFYTSDETGQFVIYSEGMTVDGKVFTGQTVYEVE